MRKYLVVFLVLCFSLTVSGQTLQDFSFEPGRTYSIGFTGGESFTQEVSFDVEGFRDVPVVLRLEVESQDYSMSGSGAEFNVSGEWRSDSGVSDELDFSYRLVNGTGIYRTHLGSDGLVSPGTQSVSLLLESSTRIVPDNYSVSLEVRSSTGFEYDRKRVEVLEGSNSFDVGDNRVYIDSRTSGNVTLSSYSDLAVSPPSGEAFVGGVEVNASGIEVEDGRVRIGYSQSVIARNRLQEDSIGIYRFDRSTGEWTTEGIRFLDQDFARNYVLAEVDHFSSYVAFADVYYRSPPNIDFDDLEPVEDSGEDSVQEQGGEESGDESEQGSDETEPGIPGIEDRIPDTVPGNAAPQSPVGSFLSSPISRTGAVILVLIGLVAVVWKLRKKGLGNLKYFDLNRRK